MDTPLSGLEIEDALDIDSEDELAEAMKELEPLTYFGTDFDVHGLVRRLNEGDVVVPSFDPAVDSGGGTAENFQRKFVWQRPQMDRFVESLLLGYPVPGIFLVQQPNKQLLVLDGQQRLVTLQLFYPAKGTGQSGFQLSAVEERFKGLTYDSLDNETRRQLDNTFIHATVVRYNPDEVGIESVYSLFERLNSGGTKLYPQEIRVALFQGELLGFIRDLNSHPSWRAIFGPPSQRLKDQELILRFLAFWENEDRYERPLKTFLNDYLGENKNMSAAAFAPLADVFRRVTDFASATFGRRALKPASQVNAAFSDALLIGLASRLERGPIEDKDGAIRARQALLGDPIFQAAIGRATADEDRVIRRLEMSRLAFADLR